MRVNASDVNCSKRHEVSGSIKHRTHWTLNPAESSGLLTLLSVALAVPAALIVYWLEVELILPAFSVLLFSGAAVAVVLACSVRTETDPEKLTLWDVAGGLVLTGCAASVLGEPEQVTQLFEHLFERRSNTQ